jgi:hypothetical protein
MMDGMGHLLVSGDGLVGTSFWVTIYEDDIWPLLRFHPLSIIWLDNF